MQRIVIKIGTNVITESSGLINQAAMRHIIDQVIALKKQKTDVILVSSGAVAAGRSLITNTGDAEKIGTRQLLAAVGQIKLMELYGQRLRKGGYQCAQVLATKEDFRDRRHYLCMRDCMSTLLHDNVIPICNENDVVAVDELMFTDNDELAGLIAAMVGADAVIILTSVDGLYDRDPNDPQAQLIHTVDGNTKNFKNLPTQDAALSKFGRGGIHTKCRVAKKLSHLGITTHIANGTRKEIILDLMIGKKNLGTTFTPSKKLSPIKKWIAHSDQQGSVFINTCAVESLLANDKARSLLPVGITKVTGEFSKGDVIQVKAPKGDVIGYGIAQYGSEAAAANVGQRNKKPLIHYDYLYLNPDG